MRPCERWRPAAAFVVWAVSVLRTLPASADEVISDPELTGSKPSAPKGDEVISDPELGGGKATPPAGSGGSALPPAGVSTSTYEAPSSRPEYPRDAIWRVTLGTRWGIDTQWARPSQDIVEGTTIGAVEVSQRRSDALLLSVGLRARHGFGMRRDGNTRSELDVLPVSAFADVTLAEGFHVRAGYQVITMGRFDVFSATNFLAVHDLRSGPVTMPEAAAFGQPAIRFDFDKVQGFTLQAFYLPFFTPDIVGVYGSNYSLADRVIDGSPPGQRDQVEAAFTRSGLSSAGSNALRGLAPAPNLTTPQGAVRATLQGSLGELSATVGTALERLPSVEFVGTEPLVHHDRFGVGSVDAATDVGPVQLGVEAAYMMHRTLGASGIETVMATPNIPVNAVDHANLFQGGLRAELVEAAGWAAELEGFVTVALSKPSDPNLSWFTMEQGKLWRGVAGGVHFAPPDTRIRLELGGALFSGPSYMAMPRAEWEAVKTVFLEVGAVFVGGPAPTLTVMPMGPFAGAAAWTGPVSLGGLFSDVDQVFTGVRWVP